MADLSCPKSPDEETCILYGPPGLRPPAKYLPLEVVTFVTELLVGSYVMVTVAPLTAEPLDVTVPLISEVSSCDIANGERKIDMIDSLKK